MRAWYVDEPRPLPADWAVRIWSQLWRDRPARLEAGGDASIRAADVSEYAESPSHAQAFLRHGVHRGLLLKVGRGRYVPLRSRVVMDGRLVSHYWSLLLQTHDALDQLDVPHAFTCLQAMQHADFVSGIPMPVIEPGHGAFDVLEAATVASLDDVESVAVDGLTGPLATVPRLGREPTAAVLLASGRARLMAAGRELSEGLDEITYDPLRRVLAARNLGRAAHRAVEDWLVARPEEWLRKERMVDRVLAFRDRALAAADGARG